MNIDERLERLTERHEALTQSVEMLAADNRQMAEENKQRDRRMGEVMEGIARLLHVAEIHEHRLSELEGGEG
jgi:archaellum component FlaC